MIDPLVIEAELRRLHHGERVIRFDDLLGTLMRQASVSDQNAKPAGVQVMLALAGYAVVYYRQSHVVGRAMPPGSLQRQTCGYGAVDIRELIRLNIVRSFSKASKSAKIAPQLLL